jgi:hypothetical protein
VSDQQRDGLPVLRAELTRAWNQYTADAKRAAEALAAADYAWRVYQGLADAAETADPEASAAPLERQVKDLRRSVRG